MYIRDKRSPTPKSETVSRVMSANKAKNTVPEITLRKALWHAGLRGYRLHPETVIGRPDIAFIGRKLAIFVHGCFWHRCSKCNHSLPKNNTEFWKAKFDRNVARDEGKRSDLTAQGWNVITVWECDLRTNLDQTVATIQKAHR